MSSRKPEACISPIVGALAALEEEARAFEDKFDEEAFASFLEM